MSGEKESSHKHSSPGSVTMKWWQLLIVLLVVVAFSVGVTITVNRVMQDNAQHEASSETYKKPKKEKQPENASPKKNERGHLVKHIGELASIYDVQSKQTVASWTVNNITVDAQCVPEYDGAPTQPENGHFVLLDITAQTTPQFEEAKYGSVALGEGGLWTYVQKDGTQWNGEPSSSTAMSCLPQNEQFPTTLGTGIKAQGKVLLDLPSTDGYLVYNNGWEYPLS